MLVWRHACSLALRRGTRGKPWLWWLFTDVLQQGLLLLLLLPLLLLLLPVVELHEVVVGRRRRTRWEAGQSTKEVC